MVNSIHSLHQIEKHRQEFPGLNNKIYFNFGGQGTLPRCALEAIIDAHNYLQLQGPFSIKVNTWIQHKTEQLREEIASELGATPQSITLTENVTAGCNIVLWGIDWQKGDHILLSDCEHPGIIAIIKELARRFEIEFSTCPIKETLNGGDPVTVIAQHLRPNTRLLVITHLLWNTGQLLPLKDIVKLCHHHGPGEKQIRVLVDAAQSVGSIPLNLRDIQVDYYAFTGHKWLCGPAGVGALYIRPQMIESLHPTFIGWRGIEQDPFGYPVGWKNNGQRFEVATSAYPQYEGLRAAIALHHQWGTPETRYQRICELSAYLWQQLSEFEGIQCLKNSPPQGGLVSFQPKYKISSQTLVQALEKRGFLLRTLSNPNCVRACIHYFTLPAEIEQLVEAIKNIVTNSNELT
ncbi:aminotransferase class V [Gloeothece citriformis PCC 7424]|uniref:Aminotransferase class V n=1 Tax=Gloeothece citriformis (strain PCC 7424) TaxID=65393 RepID=B7KG30_GLOC7|nr:aminotransferase class V-fold PLP-dependent enzyme [Gloeothece citriformis]ACK69223.1 aminotransferase class V [Gloeothece citriformis PCC 7424]